MLRAALLFLVFAAACATEEEPTGAPGTGDAGAQVEAGQTGGLCGGIAGFQCETEGDYCAMEAGACKDIADAAGVCTPRPQICTREYRPVCGCDAKSYSNACSAAAAGVSVSYEGACIEG